MIRKHSVKISQHKTSISLEDEFWAELKNIAKKQNKTLNAIIIEIDNARKDLNLCSAIRVFILQELKK